jgi:hypothetical protein
MNHRTIKYSIALFGVMSTGCAPFGLEAFVLAFSDAAPRIAATPCRSAACDRTQWTVIKIFPAAASRIWPEEAGFTYFFDFIPTRPDGWQPADPVVSGSVRAADQRLALVTEAGRLILADFGQTEALAEMHLDAVGVSWNNAGDHLGVAVRSTTPPHYRLQILTPEFDPLREFEVDLPLPGPDAIDWRLVVSWNSDDTWIAVSTDAPRAGELEPRAVLLDLQTGRATAAAISSVFFIGRSTFVGIDEPRPAQLSGLAGRGLVEGDMADGLVREVRRIPGAHWVVASDPRSGVFAALEPMFTGIHAVFPIGLRTVERGPDLVSGYMDNDPTTAAILIAPH